MLQRLFSILLWGVTTSVAAPLLLRFGMRAVGVRDDLPFAGTVYSLTVPLVEPFYRFFPAAARFDYPAVEWAALVAAGGVVAVGLGVYVVGLLLTRTTYREST